MAPQPDCTLLLDLPVEVGSEACPRALRSVPRTASKTEPRSFSSACAQGYLRLARHEPTACPDHRVPAAALPTSAQVTQ